MRRHGIQKAMEQHTQILGEKMSTKNSIFNKIMLKKKKDLEDRMLSEINQAQKDNYYRISLTGKI